MNSLSLPLWQKRSLLLVLLLLWLWPLSVPLLDKADSIAYLAPAISLVNDGDLLYYNEYSALGMNARYFRPTPQGLVGNHANIGMSLILSVPFGLERLLEGSQNSISASSMAALQATALLFIFLWAWSSILLLRQTQPSCIVQDGWSRISSGSVVLFIYLGTPLFFYTHAQSLRPHLLSACLATVYILYFCSWRRTPHLYSHAIMGITAATLMLIRSQTVLLVLFPLADMLYRLWDARKQGDLSRRMGQESFQLLALSIPIIAAMGLSFAVGRLLYGTGSRGSLLHSLTHAEIHILNSLFHPHHGLFAWSPLLILAIIGLALFIQRQPRLAVPLLVVVAVQLFLNGSNYDANADRYHWTRHWAGGASFGARRYLCCIPFFLIGLNELLKRCRKRWLGMLCLGMMVLSSLWSLNLALLARKHPFLVMERHMSWFALFELQHKALQNLGQTVLDWLTLMPPPEAAFKGWLIAVVLVFIGFSVRHLWGLVPLTRRFFALSLGFATLCVAAGIQARAVESNTLKAKERQKTELALFEQRARATAWRIQRAIRIGDARIREQTGDLWGSLRHYEEALVIGLGRKSLKRYLQLSAQLEGRSGQQRRIRALRTRYRDHPILKEVLDQLGIGDDKLRTNQ